MHKLCIFRFLLQFVIWPPLSLMYYYVFYLIDRHKVVHVQYLLKQISEKCAFASIPIK